MLAQCQKSYPSAARCEPIDASAEVGKPGRCPASREPLVPNTPIFRVLRHLIQVPEAAMNPIELQILRLVATYYTLTRAQITRLVLPTDQDGRRTRRHMLALRQMHLINRTHMEV